MNATIANCAGHSRRRHGSRSSPRLAGRARCSRRISAGCRNLQWQPGHYRPGASIKSLSRRIVMNGTTVKVRENYSTPALTDRISSALATIAPEDQILSEMGPMYSPACGSRRNSGVAATPGEQPAPSSCFWMTPSPGPECRRFKSSLSGHSFSYTCRRI